MGKVICAVDLFWVAGCRFSKDSSYHFNYFSVGPFENKKDLQEWRRHFVRSLVFLAKFGLVEFSIKNQEIVEFFRNVEPGTFADANEHPTDSAHKFYEAVLQLWAGSPMYDFF